MQSHCHGYFIKLYSKYVDIETSRYTNVCSFDQITPVLDCSGSVSNNLILTLFVRSYKDKDVIESVHVANCTGLSQDLCCGGDVVVT